MNEDIKNNKSKFYIVSAKKRILVKLFEYIVLIGINLLITYLFTFNSLNWSNSTLLVPGWQFSVYLLFDFIVISTIWFCYFIVCPYFFRGYTLITKIFKLKLYTNKENWKFINFLKRECFTWIPLNVVCLVMSLVSFAFVNPVEFLSQIVTFSSTSGTLAERTIGYIFTFLYIISSIPLFFVFINTLANNCRKTAIDKLSNIVLIDISTQIKIDEPHYPKNYDLPIMLDEEELEKL